MLGVVGVGVSVHVLVCFFLVSTLLVVRLLGLGTTLQHCELFVHHLKIHKEAFSWRVRPQGSFFILIRACKTSTSSFGKDFHGVK